MQIDFPLPLWLSVGLALLTIFNFHIRISRCGMVDGFPILFIGGRHMRGRMRSPPVIAVTSMGKLNLKWRSIVCCPRTSPHQWPRGVGGGTECMQLIGLAIQSPVQPLRECATINNKSTRAREDRWQFTFYWISVCGFHNSDSNGSHHRRHCDTSVGSGHTASDAFIC